MPDGGVATWVPRLSSWGGMYSELSFQKLKTAVLRRLEVWEGVGRSDGA